MPSYSIATAGAGPLGTRIELPEIEDLAKGTLVIGDGSGGPSGLAVGAEGTIPVSRAAGANGILWESVGGATHPVDDTQVLVRDPADNTKLARIDVGAVATATTRILTVPDHDVTLGSIDDTSGNGDLTKMWSTDKLIEHTLFTATSALVITDNDRIAIGKVVEAGGIDSFTVLMLNADGTDGSTSFLDSSTSPHTITAFANAQVDTAFVKFGTGAALFDGTSDRLGAPNSADWNFGTGNLTVDFWFRATVIASTHRFLVISKSDSLSPANYVLDAGLTLNAGIMIPFFNVSDGSSDFTAGGVTADMADGVFHHFEGVLDGTTLRLFIDGVQSVQTATISAALNFDANMVLRIGAIFAGAAAFPGSIDEIRVSKGVARHTANFTPPVSAYTTASTETYELSVVKTTDLATLALDNLASVAINTSLISDTDITDDLGTGDIRWRDIHTETVNAGLTVADTLKLRGRDVDGAVYVDVLTIISANTVTADLNALVTIGGNAILDSTSTVSALTTVGTIATGTWEATDVAVAHGGTGASTAGDARTNLGLVIGTDVQAFDAGLLSIAGLTTLADRMIFTTASDTYSVTTLTAFARTILDDATQGAVQTTLDVDPAGTDNSTDVTLAGTPDYITIVGQVITRGLVVLTTDVSGILPGANGGTGNGFFAVTGPTTSLKTFTFPDATATVLTDNANVTLAQGGTNASLTAVNGGVVFSTASAFAISAAGTSGQVLTAAGAATPVFETLSVLVSELANGTDGELITWDAAGVATTVGAGTAGQILMSQGAGTVSLFTSTLTANLTISKSLPNFTLLDTAGSPADFILDANQGGPNSVFARVIGKWNGNTVTEIRMLTGADTVNKDEGQLTFHTAPPGGGSSERLRIDENGDVSIGVVNANQRLTVQGTMDLREQAAANADTINYGQIWVESTTPNKLKFTDDVGTDFTISGTVLGPASSTDNAIARFNGTGGLTLQNGTAIVNDNGMIQTAATGGYADIANTPAELTADANNFAINGFGIVRASSDALRNVTGIIAGIDGENLRVTNVGSFDIVFKHEDSGSAAANRIITNDAGDLTLNSSESGDFWYDNTSSRWRVVGRLV